MTPNLFFKKAMIIFFLSLVSLIVGKSQNNLNDEIALNFSYHIIHKDNSKDVYIKWNQSHYENEIYLNNILYNGEITGKGFLLENITFPFEIGIIQKEEGVVVNQKVYTVQNRDNAILDVSDEMYSKIKEWEYSGQDILLFSTK